MARNLDAKCRQCRREGEKLFLKGEKCFTDKCAIERRNFPPGQHGKRRSKILGYGIQLREKQKVKRFYGILENLFRLTFQKAERMRGVTGENLLSLLERRLDNVVHRLGFAASRTQARQLVRHGHVLVNGRKVNIPSFVVKNLGMVGFVTSAVAVRFVFPAVSLEGESFWIIRSSPLPLKEFLWAKFWSSLLPLLLLAEVLIVLSNILLKVWTLMMVIGVTTVALMTFGIAALGVGMGAVFPRFRHQHAAQIPTGFGGIVYMLASMLFIGAIILLEAWPVYRIFTSQTMGRDISAAGWARIALSFGLVLAINAAAFIIPLRKGLKRLIMQEF